MTVRKKVLRPQSERGRLASPEALGHIRELIQTLPPDDQPGEDTMAAKKVKKGAAKASKKSDAPAKKEGTSLAEICKSMKIEPRTARRKLRNAQVSVEGDRWHWTKQSDIDKVKKVLQGTEDKAAA